MMRRKKRKSKSKIPLSSSNLSKIRNDKRTMSSLMHLKMKKMTMILQPNLRETYRSGKVKKIQSLSLREQMVKTIVNIFRIIVVSIIAVMELRGTRKR